MEWAKDIGVACGLGFAGGLAGCWAIPFSLSLTVAYVVNTERQRDKID